MSNTGSVDVAIVGGGIIGASSAYYLAKMGMSVALLERDDIAQAASGKNLGYVSYVAMLNRPEGARLEMIRQSRELYRGLPEELGIEFGLRATGGLFYFLDEKQRLLYSSLAARLNAVGVAAEIVDRDALDELAPALAPDIPGALYVPDEAHDEPAKAVMAFVRAAERMGARVHRGAEVVGFATEGSRVTGVVTRDGPISSGCVVLAAGSWAGELARSLGIELPIVPWRAQVMSTVPMPPGLRTLLTGPGAVLGGRFKEAHHSNPEPGEGQGIDSLPGYAVARDVDDPRMNFDEYACQTADGRYFFGCPVDVGQGGYQPYIGVSGIRETCELLPRTLPVLENAYVERTWAGPIPITPDGLPIVDRFLDPAGLIVAAGHSNGNTTGPVTGKLVASLASGDATPPWAGELAYNRPAIVEALRA